MLKHIKLNKSQLYNFAIFVFFIFFVLFMHYPYWNQLFYWDSLCAYYSTMQSIYDNNLNPIPDSKVNVGHPTLIFFLVALFWKIFSVKMFWAHLVIYIITAICSFIIYCFGRDLIDRTFGITAGILFLFLPLIYAQSDQVLLDLPLAVFALGTLYFLWKENWKTYILFAILLSLTKAYGWCFIVLFSSLQMFRILAEKKEWKTLLFTFTPIIVYPLYIIVVFLITKIWFAGEYWKQKFTNQTMIKSPLLYLDSLYYNIKTLVCIKSGLEILLLLILLFSIIFVIKFLGNKNKKRYKEIIYDGILTNKNLMPLLLLVSLAIFGMVLISFMQSAPPRYFIIIYPPILLLGLYAGYKLLKDNRRKFLVLSLFLIFIFVIKWHYTNAEKITSYFPQKISTRLYSLLAYDNPVPIGGYPFSYNGEISLYYADIVRLIKPANEFIKREYPTNDIIVFFPIRGYFTQPVPDLNHYNFKIKYYYHNNTKKGDIVILSSVDSESPTMDDLIKTVKLKKIKKLKSNSQWIKICMVEG